MGEGLESGEFSLFPLLSDGLPVCRKFSRVWGNRPTAETSNIETYEAYINGQKFYFIDPLGFDDTYRTDIDVLRMLADWLNQTYQANVRLGGVIYLHRIGDNRMAGSAMKNLRMFSKLCGDDALSLVVLVTTMWDLVSDDDAVHREEQLTNGGTFWAEMIDKGSVVFQQDSGEQSARRIVLHILSLAARQRLASPKIRTEMTSGKALYQTSAGLEVEAEKEKLRAKHEAEMRQLRVEWEEALKVRDV